MLPVPHYSNVIYADRINIGMQAQATAYQVLRPIFINHIDLSLTHQTYISHDVRAARRIVDINVIDRLESPAARSSCL